MGAWGEMVGIGSAKRREGMKGKLGLLSHALDLGVDTPAPARLRSCTLKTRPWSLRTQPKQNEPYGPFDIWLLAPASREDAERR